ncbi:NPCBM/NEW2 domain-containing protein [Deinococcus pimensis]|uniref:NPCBM/NEW2 domain-containing protein n=1 Tax=Deinococcus pimensis TaxID=309888 RepID=UPI0004B19A83|nr:NPCBM/NEW2 domain-containing protein [Deinococcus pimensis]
MSRLTYRTFLPLTLPLLLLACGQTTSPAASQDDLGPYANGASYPWSYTQQPGNVTPLVLDPGANNLYYEPILSATNGWGPIEINTSNGEQNKGDGRKLSVGGKTYDVGYGVHADSELRWSLRSTLAGVTCNKLDGYVGVDDEVGDRGSVTFQIWLDGAKVWDSGVMTGKDGARFYSVDTTGKTDLRLVVTNGGDNFYYDHADWIQPTVHCQQGTVTPPPATGAPGTLDTSYGTNGSVPVPGLLAALAGDGTNLILGAGKITRLSPDGAVLGTTPLPLQNGESLSSLVVQPDGKVVLVGARTLSADGSDVLVIRLNPDLTPDTSFGDAGRVVLNLSVPANGGGSTDRATAVTLTSDGKIVVVGTAIQPIGVSAYDQQGLFVLRLGANGSRDSTFGTNGVIYRQLEDVLPGSNYSTNEEPGSVAVLADGRIVVAGTSNLSTTATAAWALRYLPNGTVDTTYGQNGVWTPAVTPSPQGCGGAFAGPTTVTPTGEVVVASSFYRANGVEIDRISADGRAALKRCFEFGPTAGAGPLSIPTAVEVTPTGQVLVGGRYQPSGYESLALVRFGADLMLDTTFGKNGVTLITPEQYADVGDLLVQPGGRYLMTTFGYDNGGATYRINP